MNRRTLAIAILIPFTLLTLYEGRTLLRLAPGLAMVEAGVWATALRRGWLREKARAASSVVRDRRQVARRRKWVQSRRRVGDAGFVPVLEWRIVPSERSGEQVPRVVNRVVSVLGQLGSGRPPHR